MRCPICNVKYCYCRNHESRCKCGFFDTYKYLEKKNRIAIFKCNNCGNIRKMPFSHKTGV